MWIIFNSKILETEKFCSFIQTKELTVPTTLLILVLTASKIYRRK